MDIRTLLDNLGISTQEEHCLKRALQVFSFFRGYGYAPEDLFMTHDAESRMGIALQLGGRTLAAVACGTYDTSTYEEFERKWIGFAERLPTLSFVALHTWVYADGAYLDCNALALALARQGIRPMLRPLPCSAGAN